MLTTLRPASNMSSRKSPISQAKPGIDPRISVAARLSVCPYHNTSTRHLALVCHDVRPIGADRAGNPAVATFGGDSFSLKSLIIPTLNVRFNSRARYSILASTLLSQYHDIPGSCACRLFQPMHRKK